jgi:adenylate cyclase
MKIRSKVLIVVLPLLIFPMVLVGFSSFISAKNGITKVAREFLSYKTLEMYKYCRRQEDILIDTGLSNLGDYRNLAKKSAQEYADAIRLSKTGYFLVFDSSGNVIFPRDVVQNVSGFDFYNAIAGNEKGLITFTLNGVNRVGYYIYFEPWDWYLLLSEMDTVFFKDAHDIRKQVAYTIGLTLIVAAGLILLFIKRLTDPIGNVVQTMKKIITSNDLSRRVRVEYDDEIGYLATWFNRMVGDLELAYNQVKKYAYRSILAKNSEERVRHIFQKYVPGEIIDEVLKTKGEKLLVGKKQFATILFSDIRSFTSISERLSAEELVKSLNTYFNIMVSIIIDHKGTIDKFIGDAIMAIYGAPVQYEDDPLEAVHTALEMIAALDEFNKKQVRMGRPIFRIGVGVNTGEVVVGNIGSNQKLDYTCIGDAVNLASRLEGLTKMYGVPVIISENTYAYVKDSVQTREIDAVRVKGKVQPVQIYQPYAIQNEEEKKAYEMFNNGIRYYRERKFEEALNMFSSCETLLQGDTPSSLYVDRCKALLTNPPTEDWDGVFTAKTK